MQNHVQKISQNTRCLEFYSISAEFLSLIFTRGKTPLEFSVCHKPCEPCDCRILGMDKKIALTRRNRIPFERNDVFFVSFLPVVSHPVDRIPFNSSSSVSTSSYTTASHYYLSTHVKREHFSGGGIIEKWGRKRSKLESFPTFTTIWEQIISDLRPRRSKIPNRAIYV